MKLIARLLFAVLVLCAASAYCQNNDDPTMDVGFKPYGSYHGGDIDSVNLSNGFLNLHIPLVEYPQRGALNYSAQIIYNNHRGWSVIPDCINENTCHPVWAWKGGGVTLDTDSPDFFTAGPGPYVKSSKFIVYTGTTADGASHQMAITPAGSAESIDGSGLWQNGSVFGASGGIARNKSGMVNDGINLEDSNGNILSFPTTVPSMTDTMGRAIPIAFSPGATDFSGCTGPLPTLSASIINFAGYKGATRTFKACFSSVALQSNFNTTGFYNDLEFPIAEGHTTVGLLQSLVLYNGTSWTTSLAWTFEYNSRNPGDSSSVNYGDLTKITLPTGGTISYTWGFIGTCDTTGTTPLSRRVTTRTVDANDGSGPQKWTYNGGIVTDPNNNDTVHTFTGLNFSCSLYETQTQYFQGSFQSGTLLKTVNTDYRWMANPFDNLDGNATPPTVTNVFPIRVTTTWPSGKVSKVEKDYDSNLVFTVPGRGQFTGSYGLVLETREYDYTDSGSTPVLLRKTDYTYKAFDGSATAGAFLSANMLDRVSSITTFDGAGNKISQVNYGYDEFALQPSGVATQHKSTPTNGTTRGNLTSESHWLNTTNTFLQATKTYYDTGTPYKMTDPGGHTSTNFYGAGFQSQQDFAGGYITESDNALQQSTFFDYDLTTGLKTAEKDANGGITNLDYDIYQRTKQKTAANGGSTVWKYTDTLPPSFTATSDITSSLSHIVEADLDGLGRAAHKKLVSDPAGADVVDITYDGVGKMATVSNPHRDTPSSTDGITHTIYDVLGRVTQIVHQDGSISTTDYSKYPIVTVSDEAGMMRRSRTDGLGRLVEVDEPGDPSSGIPASTVLNITGSGLQSKTTSIPATSGTGSITINGAEQGKTVSAPTCRPNQPCGFAVGTLLYDSGTVSLTVNGHTDSVTFGQASTASDIANRLASAIRTNSPYVDYTSVVVNPTTLPAKPSVTIFLQARTTGTSTNYSLSSSSTFDVSDFNTPSYTTTTSGPSLTGGTDAPRVGIVTMDSGTVTVHVGSVSAQASFGINASTTGPQLASVLASALNSQSPPFTATPANSSIQIQWNAIGAAANGTPVTSSATWDTSDFAGSSFTIAGSALANGGDPYPSGVDHPNVTLYFYDALNNLTCVEQHGDAQGTGCAASADSDAPSAWRVRRFSYDSLSRLLRSSNPETNTAFDGTKYVRIPTTYVYDPDNNLLRRTSLASNQNGTATNTISYCYDALHRPTAKGYGVIPSCPLAGAMIAYTYDVGTNGIGHMTSLTDQAGTGSYSYDIMGQLVTETRMLLGAPAIGPGGTTNKQISKMMGYEYNLDGSLAKLHYPSGAIITYTSNGGGQPTSAVDVLNGINYVMDASFDPTGAVAGFVSGKGATQPITSAFSYNNRLQPINISASTPTQTVFSIGYDFHHGEGDNGNVWTIYNNRDHNRDQTFTYDTLGRLASAQNAGTDCSIQVLQNKTEYWGNSYSYDSWGNLLQKTITKCGAENLNLTADSHNWIHATGVDYQYDAAGNMTYNATSQQSYIFDPENRLSVAEEFIHTYDDEGNRIKKANGATGTLYWYMAPGVVGESDLNGNLKSEYVFFQKNRIARRDLATGIVSYYFSDNLHSASVISDANGNITFDSDHYPWGGELAFVNSDSNTYKFTGKERDGETGLDYFGARHYSNGLGRFLTADWSDKPVGIPYADMADPQSLNLYSYVRNRPTVLNDLDGHDCTFFEAPCSERGPASINNETDTTISVERTTTTATKSTDGTITTVTSVTTTATFSTEPGHEGQFLGATVNTWTTTYDTSGEMKEPATTTTGEIPTTHAQAVKAIGADGMQKGVDAATPGYWTHVGRGIMKNPATPHAVFAVASGICFVAEPCGAAEEATIFIGEAAHLIHEALKDDKKEDKQ